MADWIGSNQGAAVTDEKDAQTIARIIEARAQAVRAGQVDALMADVADDVVTFDVVDPLRRLGKLAARSRTAAWLESFDGPIGLKIRDLQITVDGDVASHSRPQSCDGNAKR
jgi:ketosteroid isomerase-like protein